ncbi:hypothetical protein [Desulfosporosinus sp. FKA]|uniref:hypothetical protein n=1 Tax=Desulfosporosinus sp. FKA TaxID=1969834 RepID=UPI000B4A2290|nr:hypothetical protein [Desulfosporosinus sp. FKA]
MKEHNIWLSQEELQQMLHGSIFWADIACRTSTSRIGMRRSEELAREPRPVPEETAQILESKVFTNIEDKNADGNKPLEGQPVVWLLGSIGLLTVSSWFYFVLFSK